MLRQRAIKRRRTSTEGLIESSAENTMSENMSQMEVSEMVKEQEDFMERICENKRQHELKVTFIFV